MPWSSPDERYQRWQYRQLELYARTSCTKCAFTVRGPVAETRAAFAAHDCLEPDSTTASS